MGRKIAAALVLLAFAGAATWWFKSSEAEAPSASSGGAAQAQPGATGITVNAPWILYNEAGFAAAQAAGKTIVVDISASWCPTCRAQAPTLDEVAQDPALAQAVLYKVDFDVEKAFLSQHRIPRQSTILVFRGTEETARSVAETDPERLRNAILAGVEA